MHTQIVPYEHGLGSGRQTYFGPSLTPRSRSLEKSRRCRTPRRAHVRHLKFRLISFKRPTTSHASLLKHGKTIKKKNRFDLLMRCNFQSRWSCARSIAMDRSRAVRSRRPQRRNDQGPHSLAFGPVVWRDSARACRNLEDSREHCWIGPLFQSTTGSVTSSLTAQGTSLRLVRLSRLQRPSPSFYNLAAALLAALRDTCRRNMSTERRHQKPVWAYLEFQRQPCWWRRLQSRSRSCLISPGLRCSWTVSPRLSAATVHVGVEARRANGTYTGTFSPQFHANGYERRAGSPTVLDAACCCALGATASVCTDCT